MAGTLERWTRTVQRLDAVGELRVQSMSSKRRHPVPSARVTRAELPKAAQGTFDELLAGVEPDLAAIARRLRVSSGPST